MSFNHNFYHRNFRGNATFHSNMSAYVLPPPPPPPYFMSPAQHWPTQITDEEFLKQFEHRLQNVKPAKRKPPMSISKVRDEMRNMIQTLNDIKRKERSLSENINDLSDDEWNLNLKEIEENKSVIAKILTNINNLNVDVLRNLLAKRSAKRLRQKRQRKEKKSRKDEWMKQNKENSRKIDEYLQKVQDDINKAKQEEEAKLQADAVLRDTIRKKQDAKKYIAKMDTLVKLRKARQNTAKGRGENVSEKEADVFEDNIEKLKALWAHRLALYEKEEAELRSKLMQASEGVGTKINDTERDVTVNLDTWKQVLFGGTLPQVDFAGNVGRFVHVRSQWDKYLDKNGTSIPIGWVVPTAPSPNAS